MIVRVVLAVVVATALLAAAVPAVREVQQSRADQTVTTSADRLRTAIEEVERDSDPVPLGVPGARRRVRIEVPDKPSQASLRIEPVGTGSRAGADGRTNGPDAGSEGLTRVRYTASGTDETIHVLDTNIRIVHGDELASRDTTLAVREDTVLTLSYRLVNGTPTVTVARGFKSGDGSTQSHVGTAG